MTRADFILATSIALFVAFCLGWAARWLVQRVTRPGAADMGELARLSQETEAAERERDEAIAYLRAREAELTDQLQRTEADLRTATDGLREARAETETLRARLVRG